MLEMCKLKFATEDGRKRKTDDFR